MGRATQTQKQTTGPWGPTHQPLEEQGIPRIEAQFQTESNDPNRLVPQAQGYARNVLSGNFLDPASNPHLSSLTGAIREAVFPAVSSVFSRAGRGNSASDSGLAGSLTRGFTSAMAGPLFNQYNAERGMMQQTAGMSGALDAAGSQPLDQYLQRMAQLASLGQKGTTLSSATPSALQVIAGLGLTGSSMMKSMGGGGGGSGGGGGGSSMLIF